MSSEKVSSPKAKPASPKAASPKAASPKAAPASPKASSPKATPASPSGSSSKRSASPAKEEKSPSAKKSKKSASDKSDSNAYHLNVNKAVDAEHEHKSFHEIVKLPPSALQGLATRADKMFAHFNIKTIEDLANWKFYQVAKAVVTLAALEQKDGRHEKSIANINAALDKEYEKKALKEIVKAPVSALSGLADWADEVLKPLKIKTVGDLGEFRFAKWSEALVALAKYENADGSS